MLQEYLAVPLKRLSILGSTGSIGCQTLDIVRNHPEDFSVSALCAGGNNIDLLLEQILEFSPSMAAVPSDAVAQQLKEKLANARTGNPKSGTPKCEIVVGEEGICNAASFGEVDTVVSGIVGARGIAPTAAAARAGKIIALANKETLVAAGSIIMPMATKYGARLVPVDSEHSAIHQSMSGYSTADLKKIILTGSGGPFRTWTKAQIERAEPQDALKHPNWSMGQKITIDSATLMNKGLEIIEARWLFEIDASKIEVLIHPQSILHSAVEFVDGSVVGQLGMPDMHLPIHYALYYPERKTSRSVPLLDLVKLGSLSFEEPDYDKFPCLSIARRIAATDDSSAAVLNAANEELVYAFLRKEISFYEISSNIEKILEKHNVVSKPSLEDIVESDLWARKAARDLCSTKVG